MVKGGHTETCSLRIDAGVATTVLLFSQLMQVSLALLQNPGYLRKPQHGQIVLRVISISRSAHSLMPACNAGTDTAFNSAGTAAARR
jgi:hypothetical protein